MKPAVCEVCGVTAWTAPDDRPGEWLEFENWRPVPLGEAPPIGHPEGLAYFCADHLPRARELQHLTSDKAVFLLRQETGMSPPVPVVTEVPKIGRLQRLLTWFK